jgi:hypothetical protein
MATLPKKPPALAHYYRCARSVASLWKAVGQPAAHKRKTAHVQSPTFVNHAESTVRQAVTSMSHFDALNSKTEGKMALASHLAELSEKHRSLERQIEEELSRPGADDLEISKLKKEKLRIKDEMTKLKTQTTH